MRGRVSIPRLLEQLGIRARHDGRRWVAICPNPDHDDKIPSWTIVDDGSARHGSHLCRACGFGGGPWELAAAVRGLELSEAGDWVWTHVVGGQNRATEDDDVPVLRVAAPRGPRPRELSLPRHVRIPSVDGADWYPRALAYLDDRGVPAWQRERWHVGYCLLGTLAWRVVVPVYTRGRLLSYVARAFIDDGRIRYLTPEPKIEPGARPDAALWGEPGFDPDVRVCTVTEGVFKAMAMERAGAPNPCAILGAHNLGAEKVEILQSFDVVLVAMDPDKAGRIAAERVADSVARYAEPVVVELRTAPDDAGEDENGAAWRAAIAKAGPALRARRTARAAAR